MPRINRHINVDDKAPFNAMTAKINGSQSLVDYKALVFRCSEEPNVKVGLFSSGGRIGQTIQGVGSMAVPGDYSDIRSPVRSRLYSALTPGGGGRSFPGGAKPTRGFRCPEGYQFGGRFTDSRYSTCGQKLFDIADLGETIGRLLGLVSGPQKNRRMPGVNADRELIRGGANVSPTVISRSPDIPRVGNSNRSKMVQVIDGASSSLAGQPDGSAYLIRRDAFALKPVVPASVLRTVPDNRNMEGATYMVSASKPDSIGKDELGLLSNTGVSALEYVLPNGSRLKLEKSRALTVGERRKLGRTVNEASSIDVSSDPTARLKAVVANSNGGIKYTEDFKGISNPNDIVNVGGKNIRRWVAESFKNSKKPKPITEISEDKTKLGKKITNLGNAVEHLDNNGDPKEISPKILHQAMAKTNAFSTTKLNASTTLHERADGKGFFEITKPETYEHLGAHLASELQKELGLKAPTVSFMGSGTRRGYMIDHPRNAVGDKGIMADASLKDADPEDMLRLAVSDWLVDERGRTPGNVSLFRGGAGDGAMATSNRQSALSGIGKAELSRRQKMGIDEVFANSRKGVYGTSFENLSASQQRAIVKQLEQIIKKADSFNWDEYMSRLMIDGELSNSEKNHLKIVQSMYQSRLETLRSSRDQFLKAIGVG